MYVKTPKLYKAEFNSIRLHVFLPRILHSPVLLNIAHFARVVFIIIAQDLRL